MLKTGSSHDRNQLIPSIEKLFHYLLIHVKHDVEVAIWDQNSAVLLFNTIYRAPKEISISPTLYTRLDACHGAGNCCRVPFDLVYSPFDRKRILDIDLTALENDFGKTSVDRFESNRSHLLNSLMPLKVIFRQCGKEWSSLIWVKKNEEINTLSGNKSCPYLFMSTDRYFCGVHPFKPLHCWYPHMTVRKTRGYDHSVNIGRMQYGRNHKFGCPVLFQDVDPEVTDGIFDHVINKSDIDDKSYFKNQFDEDFEKLHWTSDSAQSLGFTHEGNFAVGLHEEFARKSQLIRKCLADRNPTSISLWTRG